MEAFTDPFERYHPFKLDAGYLFGGRLAEAVDAAKNVLKSRSVADVKAIAEAVSSVNDQVASELAEEDPFYGPAREEWPEASDEEIASLDADYEEMNPAALRNELGELGVFLSADLELTSCDGSDGRVRFERSEALAVIALWQAAECIEEMIGRPRTPSPSYDDPFMPVRTIFPPGHPQHGRPPQDTYASVLALDAMRASTLAEQAVGQAQAINALIATGAGHPMVEDLQRADEQRREQARERAGRANDIRHDRDARYIEMAITLAISREFKFRIEAAGFAADNIETERPGRKYFSVKTIDGWLKARNWRAPNVVDPPSGRRR